MDCFKTKDGNSIVRVFHASPNAPAVDVYIDGQLVIKDLSFTNFSDYSYLPEGMHTIQVTPTGDASKVVINKMVDVPDNRIFTIAAVGNLENIELLLLEDDINEVPSTKEATLRVIHLSPNAPAVNIIANDNTVFKNINFKENSDYIKVPAGMYDVKVALSENGKVALSSKVNLKANRIYTIFAVGNPPNLGLIQSVDVNTYLCR
ncbi:DUF4397 domain-containing protein [Paraclostridium ghonii]|uniref:DUF4397 domain-containing protein n=1 Tax=Paraclostridium ghonii TaxID=29358 RepID=UPI00202CC018|nr:DUF4397 domain-containing protein [Paeniclostridium ghonii]MCM0167068.1 DUF4397 domain-containing protein [Paeniclostridium ghonii]